MITNSYIKLLLVTFLVFVTKCLMRRNWRKGLFCLRIQGDKYHSVVKVKWQEYVAGWSHWSDCPVWPWSRVLCILVVSQFFPFYVIQSVLHIPIYLGWSSHFNLVISKICFQGGSRSCQLSRSWCKYYGRVTGFWVGEMALKRHLQHNLY